MIIKKESLKRALENWQDENIFNELMDETNAIGAEIHLAKRENRNAGITNYGRIPSQYFSHSFIQIDNPVIDRLFILIAGHINTYCGKYKRIKIKNICDITSIEADTLKQLINDFGASYWLFYVEERDRFRRINKIIELRIKMTS